MKFNKLARELEVPVNELAERAENIVPDANGGTEIDAQQEQSIRALVTGNKKMRSSQSDGDSPNDTNAPFETEALSDTDLGISALDGILVEYSYRLQGLGVAHQWIKSYEESGVYPDDPDAAKRIEAIGLLRSLNIPYQAPHPTLGTSRGTGRSLALPASVRAILGNVYPNELAGIEREAFEQPATHRPQLSGS